GGPLEDLRFEGHERLRDAAGQYDELRVQAVHDRAEHRAEGAARLVDDRGRHRVALPRRPEDERRRDRARVAARRREQRRVRQPGSGTWGTCSPIRPTVGSTGPGTPTPMASTACPRRSACSRTEPSSSMIVSGARPLPSRWVSTRCSTSTAPSRVTAPAAVVVPPTSTPSKSASRVIRVRGGLYGPPRGLPPDRIAPAKPA